MNYTAPEFVSTDRYATPLYYRSIMAMPWLSWWGSQPIPRSRLTMRLGETRSTSATSARCLGKAMRRSRAASFATTPVGLYSLASCRERRMDVKLLSQFLPEDLAVYDAFEGKWLRTEGKRSWCKFAPAGSPTFYSLFSLKDEHEHTSR